MSKSRLLAGVALAALCLPVASLSPGMPLGVVSAQAQSAGVSFQLFFDELEPHGVWTRHSRYNYVFCPTGIDSSWRPYSRGRWLYLRDYGWYFASEEPFAWATYHYGRWFADQKLGWCWVPGTKWAPAWVSWRRSDNIVGWAPLPPENDGYAVSVEVSRRDLPQAYWVYVPTERFIEPDLSVNIVFGDQQPEYYTQTEFLGPVVVEGDVVVNNVIDVTYIEQTINQDVVVYEAQEAADPAAAQTVSADSQAISIFAQDVAEPTEEAAPAEAVEEAEAAAAIETEGGTAGATVEITAGDPTAPAAEAEAGAEADEQPATETETETEATTDADPGASEPEAAPAEGEAETAPEATTEEAADPAAGEAVPAEGNAAEEVTCAPEEMVGGACPVVGEEEAAPEEPGVNAEAATETDAAVEAESESAPVEAETPATEAAPAEDAPATEEAAPVEEPAPAEEAAPEATIDNAPEAEAAPAEAPAEEPGGAPAAGPLCPPETMVNGACPVPAQ